nr:MCE family protein [Bacteroidota bacterium]
MKISRELKVGFIFVAAVAVFIWGFNFLKGTDLLSGKRVLYAVYEKVDGLQKANNVMINGLKIGQVSDLRFIPGTSKILAEFYIKSSIEIPIDSEAKIYSTDLLGGKAVEIIMGASTNYVVSEDTLTSSMESSLRDQVNEQVEPLKRKAIALMRSVDSVMTVIQSIFNENTRHNLTSTVENIRNTLRNLENASSNIDTIIGDEKNKINKIMSNLESITRNLENNNENINVILSNFAALSDSLASAEIPQTFRDAKLAINNLKELSDKINRGEGTIGKLFTNDSLYFHLEKSTSELNKLLEDIRLNPKRYVKFSLF